MRYKWIELYGYGGIYNGMGLNHIKIDFTTCKTNKIIIRGANGSGKSTLVNAIHPNPDTNDCFIPNVEARKNLCLIDDFGVEYIIRYIHPITNNGRGTTKGYISKSINGQQVELNTSGNISSCKDIIYEEFNLDSNFVSLSRLSSENRGLVDRKPAERKKLINYLIAELDVYNSIYKTITKKANYYKQMINSLTYKINNLGSEIQLKSRLSNIESQLSTLEEEKRKTIEAIALVQLRIDEYITILKENNYDKLLCDLRDISTHNKVLQNQIASKLKDLGIKEINDINGFIKYIDDTINQYNTIITSHTNQNIVLLSQRETEYLELENKRSKLKSLQSDSNYMEIRGIVEKYKKVMDEYEDVFTEMGLNNINLITKNEFDLAMNSLHSLQDSTSLLVTNYSISDIKFVIDNMHDIINNISLLNESKESLSEYNNRKHELEVNIAIYKSKQDVLSMLDKRPKECIIDTCPYISEAISTRDQYPINVLINMETELSNINNEIDRLNVFIKTYMLYNEILMYVNNINKELESKMPFINKLPIRNDFKETFWERALSLDTFNDINELYKYIDIGNMIEEYKIAKAHYQEYKSQYSIYEAKNIIVDSIVNDINILIEKTDNLAKSIDDNNKIISNYNVELEKMKLAKSKVESLLSKINDDYNPSKELEKKLLDTKTKLDINNNQINYLQEQLSILNTNLGSVNSDINNLNANKESVKHSILLFEEYKNELEQYNTNYNKLEVIRKYSSPSTGIQTLYMQLYMNNILSMANDLLSLLFEGEFNLQPFIINDTEFRIPCIGTGLMHNDISSMSTAQKCMISMILSFSILYQSSTKYNVLVLDEIDGGLDTSNRGMFIDLLDRLMSILHSEQCFIISHNNELNTSLADLIVLKNNGEIYNGNIIWQY